MIADSQVVLHLLHNLTAIAVDHIEETNIVAKQHQDLLNL
jgi:hypothetical protein